MDTLSAERKSVDGNFCQLDGYRECNWVGFDQEASSVGVGTCVATGKVCEDRELGMGWDGIVFREVLGGRPRNKQAWVEWRGLVNALFES